MAISCTPTALVSGAGCLSCLSPIQTEFINTYLLQQLLGNTNTPAELASLAKCFNCLSLKELTAIQVYLLCQLANATCESLSGSGDPTNVVTPEFSGQLYHDTVADTYYRSTGITSADWVAIGSAPVVCENQEGAGDPT